MGKLNGFFNGRLKVSTRLNLVTLGLFVMVLLCAKSTKHFFGLAFMPNQTVIKINSMQLITVWYALLTCVAGKALIMITQRRIHEHKQGWLENPISANHGSTLQEVIQGLRSESVEYLAYFSSSGEKIFETTLKCPHRVGISYRQGQLIRQYPGCISVHNHPGLSITAFSPDDVSTAIKLRESQSIVVAEDVCFVLDYLNSDDVQPGEIVNYMRNLPTDAMKQHWGPDKSFLTISRAVVWMI